MPQLTILYWRDIPSQVIASAGRRNQAKVLLSQRFQDAIDRAAMRGKARDADAYLDEWRRAEPIECGGDLQAEADAVAAQLELEYDDARLKALVDAGGSAGAP
ncbi:MAG TPA: virulence factor [Alphaproteobacteria bacterium]|nr:virulence factor [Alphaproteobacteria bacterium]